MPSIEQAAWFLCFSKFPNPEDIERRLYCICARLKCKRIDAILLDQQCCLQLKKPYTPPEEIRLQGGFWGRIEEE